MFFTSIELSEIESFLKDRIAKAGKIARKYFLEKDVVRHKKQDFDFVTDADLAVEKYLKAELDRRFPRIPVMSEESAQRDFQAYRREKALFVIDPIDGTINFSHGIDHYAISIGLVSERKSLLGVCLTSDKSEVYSARHDMPGAFCNGREIKIKNVDNLSEAVILADWPHELAMRKKILGFISTVFQKTRFISIYGAAVFDLMMLARGQVHAAFVAGHQPWDVAAAGLIVRKAGAVITGADGKPFDIFKRHFLAAVPGIQLELLTYTMKLF